MNSFLTPVYLVTGFLIIYLTVLVVDLSMGVILFMFSASPVLVLWMVYRVLRADVDSAYTFEEKWYEDQ
ncbi:hypothetical protein ADIS_3127 [Lunatimonas lonarensis]|uniref:Uncharacterized protein n=1 Tax=Lunatimonas lonarensis TaxID=1232681 RepID=R7ZRH4_9BACT|nr:hypothetical protein [Lunatimonas lonarensis]EON76677.1 hypothetical protein ADIS_3127 [Lunatimonas lonarensis]